jgi:hypothetical protein
MSGMISRTSSMPTGRLEKRTLAEAGGICFSHLLNSILQNNHCVMSVMFEVLYDAPPDKAREERITREVELFSGRLTFREEPSGDSSCAVCLTYEFSDRKSAEQAAAFIRFRGEHVEGPGDYGTD